MQLGTILPDYKKMAIADEHADNQKWKDLFTGNEKFGKALHRFVQGENRWYTDDTHYSIVSHGVVKKFETRADGYDSAVGSMFVR